MLTLEIQEKVAWYLLNVEYVEYNKSNSCFIIFLTLKITVLLSRSLAIPHLKYCFMN